MSRTAHFPFRSAEARQEYLAFYDRRAERWPLPSDTRAVPTSFGDTFVRVTGPEDAPPLVLLPDHHQVALEPSDVEIEVTGLDDERHVDVRRNHLERDVTARGSPRQKRASRKHGMNARVGTRVPEADANPVAHAWKIVRALGEVEEPSRQLGGCLAAFVSDEIAAPVDRRDPGQRLARLTQRVGFVSQPAIQTELTEFHLQELGRRGFACQVAPG